MAVSLEKGPGTRKRSAVLNMRTTPELLAQVEASAAQNSLSNAQEVERRLRWSFLQEQDETPHMRNLMTLVRAVAMRIEKKTGKDWTEDRLTYCAVEKATTQLMGFWRPKPINHEVIDAIRERAELASQTLNGKLNFLVDVGVLVRAKTIEEEFSAAEAEAIEVLFEKLFEQDFALFSLLDRARMRPLFDLTLPAKDWVVRPPNREATDEDRISAKANLQNALDYVELMTQLREEERAARTEDGEVRRIGRELGGEVLHDILMATDDDGFLHTLQKPAADT